ncbi:hypothetical protein Pcinc_034096 [Petrolisthes cinctipes]|uniref:Peptidase M14 domain-containing protein n=1 Tax=Petrolisthes cinctipes TaxID=88211 RepID=A0AAE1ER26_PETCI|nr:hypothetical protein Pcinc_034096 [Petrolisthes cinctipes]
MRSFVLLLALVVAFVASRPSERQNLHGAQVLRVVPRVDTQLHYLQGLHKLNQYDFWSEPKAIGHPVDIMATAFQLPSLRMVMDHLNIKYQVMIPNVAKLVREDYQARAKAPKAMDWTSYHDYDEITAWLDELATNNPGLCKVSDVGTSYEGRTMKVLTLGTGAADNPGIFIDGGIHAREWISPATVTYIINELVNGASSTYSDLLAGVNFHFMPVINPDGYAYTFSNERLWRKTRSPQGACTGVDPNRNWDFHWNEGGASNNPCADTYCGPNAFSEIEMQVVRDQINTLPNLVSYISFHSYSQLWMYPWGWTSDLPEDWQELDSLAQDAVNALTAVHGTSYEIGSSTNTIYLASGGSDDWAKGAGNVKFSYTVELRDTGAFGFLLPAGQIIPTGEETFQGVLVVGNFVLSYTP